MLKDKKIILLLIIAVGLILRLNNLSGRSLWTDEFFTLFESTGHGVAINNLLGNIPGEKTPKLLKSGEARAFLEKDRSKGIKDVSEGLLKTDTHPPLYFWIIYGWMGLFGDNVFAIRFFSLLMGLAAVVLAFFATNYLFNEKAAVFGALFVAMSGFCVRYSQEARAYSLVLALGLLSWIFILKFEKHNKSIDAFLFCIFSALGLYTHYFYSFIAIAQFVYFSFAYFKDTAKIRMFYLAFLFQLLIFAPWFWAVNSTGYNFRNAEWIFGYPGIVNKIWYLFTGVTRYILVFPEPGILQYIFLLIGVALFVYIAFYAVKDILKKYPKQFLSCLLMFLLPLAAMLAIDIIQHGALLKQERFCIFPFLGFIPLAGYFLCYGYSRNKPAAIILILLMLASSVAISKAQFGPSPLEASIWINRESGNKPSVVIVYNIRSVIFAQSYYLNDNIYLLPVSSEKQLASAFSDVADYADKIFIAQHFHRTDSALMNHPFMGKKDIGSGFELKQTFKKGDIKVSEFVR